MNIELKLTKNEIELLVEILEEKLSTIPITDAANRFDYGVLQCKLESLLKKSLT